MEVVLLAAGKGEGLHPLTLTKHKVLMPLLGDTVLSYCMRNLSAVGIDKVVLVVNYLKDQVIKEAERIAEELNLDIQVVDQGAPLGTGHALLKALDYVGSDEFLVMYGDICVALDDLKMLTSCKAPTVASYTVDRPERYGVLVLRSDGSLREVIEKPEKPPTNLINAGLYKLTKDIEKYLSRLEPSPRGEYELTDALNMMAKETKVRIVRLGFWSDIGRPWSIIEINKYMLERVRTKVIGRIEGNVVIKGPVVIEEGAEVLSGTYIVGPVFIGKGAIIGPNAYLRPYSVVLHNSRVGFNVEVKESVIMENVHVAHQAYIGDSVIGEGSNLGAGTILANLRFDNKNVKVTIKGRREDSGRRKLGGIIGGYVKTGVNVSICPGVKVGSYSWIYPGVTVCRDVPPCVKVKEGGVIEPLEECRINE